MFLYRYCPECGEEVLFYSNASDEDVEICDACGAEVTLMDALDDPEHTP